MEDILKVKNQLKDKNMASEVKWTDAQLKAITTPIRNNLISAAAGSGKTTVLVERIIRAVTRKENPVDLDRLLVVTFTNAAASSMRKKIFDSLIAKVKEEPENQFLKKQLLKVHVAKISTIDSLCLDIVKENFQDVNVDPGFRIADETELSLIRNDTVKEMIEDHYKDPTEDFMNFVEYYTDKNDSKLEELILMLYRFSESHQEPEKWLRESAENYLNQESFKKIFSEMLQTALSEIKNMAGMGVQISNADGGPFKYAESFGALADIINSLGIEDLSDEEKINHARDELVNFDGNWKLPSIKKTEEVDDDLKLIAQNLKKNIKSRIQDILKNYFYAEAQEMFENMEKCFKIAQTLSDLTIEFGERFKEKKKEKLIADFSDVAHYALNVLMNFNENGEIIRDEKGDISYTETADLMANSFEEIIVDEYQDTNRLQEYILKAISGERFGRPNIYMVGDVKQSIYGFRMAEPGLFNEKYYDYDKSGSDEALTQLINLDANFRSRKEILDFTNLVFERIMVREVGDIDYTNGHALKEGNPDDESKDYTKEIKPEVIMINGGGTSGKKVEASLIADRINELVRDEGYSYSDIVILSRVTDNPEIEQTLKKRGISVIKNSSKGFFESFEIRLVMDLLDIIDNPYQDIPFVSVLHSPICSLSANELAVIKNCAEGEALSIYECAKKFAPLNWFMEKLEKWRERSTYMGICDFLEDVLDESGITNIVLSMPQGEGRMANIEFLRSRASAFSRGSYVGLYNFIRYIKEIPKNNMDLGNVQSVGKDTNAVQMMTIHKSKGLEFPVVFVVGCGKEFNTSDTKTSIILDRELGMGIEFRNPKTRRIGKTLLMETIRQKKKTDVAAEEMRMLYVALTRAKKKLIVTGCHRFLKSKSEGDWKLEEFNPSPKPLAYQILNSGNYLFMMGLAFAKADTSNIIRINYEASDYELENVEKALESEFKKQEIVSLIDESVDVSDIKKEFEYEYPFKKATLIQGKLSSSQLEQQDTERGELEESVQTKKFRRKGLTGAERGTAYHQVFELWDYSKEDVESQLKELLETGAVTEEQFNAVKAKDIEKFLASDIGQRMKRAFEKGTLVREKTFLMGSVHDINNEETLTGIKATSTLEDDEILMVQGIIDAYFIEDDEIILVDYKTDAGKTEEELKGIYKGQQDSYAEALEKIYDKPVKEKYLYSTAFGKEIKL